MPIKFIGRSDTGLREQLAQIQAALAALPDLEILIRSAPAIEGAMGLAAHVNETFPMLVSTYISHSVRRGVHSGHVRGVAIDDPVEQCRLGIRKALSVRVGEQNPDMSDPEIRLVDASVMGQDVMELAPATLTLRLE